MSMTDTIADMLTRIRNGQKSKLLSVIVPYSKLKCAILAVLQTEGYIKQYRATYDNNTRNILVELKYAVDGKPAICEIHRVSKPSKRVYAAISQLKGYYNSMGIYILSTSKGVISDRVAHASGVGGEVLCKIF